jgi:hypothetical protein
MKIQLSLSVHLFILLRYRTLNSIGVLGWFLKVLWIRNEFFGSVRILLFRWLRIHIRIQILFRILHEFFSYIRNINFILVFPSCNCVRLNMNV